MLLIDARRGIMSSDAQVMELLDAAGVSYQLVLTKADTLKPGALADAEAAAGEAAGRHAAAHPEIARHFGANGRRHSRLARGAGRVHHGGAERMTSVRRRVISRAHEET